MKELARFKERNAIPACLYIISAMIKLRALAAITKCELNNEQQTSHSQNA